MKKSYIVFFLTITNSIFAQKEIVKQNLIWYGLFTTVEFNDKWYFQNEIQERHFINPAEQHQFLIRSHLHRFLGNSGWETSTGISLFLQNPNNPDATVKLTVPEIRPHLEFAYKQKLGKVIFDQRYRAECRFFHSVNESRTALEDDFEYGNFRFRYKFQATIPVYKIAEKRELKLKISDEVFINAGNKIITNVFDQNRIYAGLNVDILKKLSFEVGFLNWYQQQPNGSFFNRNILRFTVFHKLDCRKKINKI